MLDICVLQECMRNRWVWYCAWNVLECVLGDSLLGHILFGVIIIMAILYVIKCSYILWLFHNVIALFNDSS